MANSKYYVVRKGRKPGIYTSWHECKAQVDRYPGAIFKSFSTLLEAKKALQDGWSLKSSQPILGSKPKEPVNEITTAPIGPIMCVDGSCIQPFGIIEFQAKEYPSGKLLFRSGPYIGGSNQVSELLALVEGIKYCYENFLDYPIYSDSITAISWVLKKRYKTGCTDPAILEKMDNAIKWLEDHHFTNPVLKWETSFWGETLLISVENSTNNN